MKKLGLLTIILFALTQITFAQAIDEQKLMQLLADAQKYRTDAFALINSGKFTEAAELYTKAIEPFLALTNPQEISISEETVQLFYTLRGTAYLAAKTDEKAIFDFNKNIEFHLNYAKKNVEKAKATPKPIEKDLLNLYKNAATNLIKLYSIDANYSTLYDKIYRKFPDKNLLDDIKLKEINDLFKQTMLEWAKIETDIYVRTNNKTNLNSALEKINFVIKQFPNEPQSFRLLEQIYRKQGKLALAKTNKAKADTLQKQEKF
jgi:tetratricopeptide (TPR) repeat protein